MHPVYHLEKTEILYDRNVSRKASMHGTRRNSKAISSRSTGSVSRTQSWTAAEVVSL